ncbi:MAG TPA: HAMP domain-containing histidine kinase [Sulfurovum sp.]|nr:HAMP domain-containing histidine kinase [Sulfurovum sp.]
MRLLKNIFTSDHDFSKKENLQKFRFNLLYSLLIISLIFTFINYLASFMEAFPYDPKYGFFLLTHIIICLFSLYLLKKDKNNYLLVANIVIMSASVLFSAALPLVPSDEFRLIWFFLLVFGSFILLGKKYGLFVMLFVLLIIFAMNILYALNFSTFAFFTFFNSLIIFTAFAYFFLEKIENDALEFETLNKKLKEKVSQEVQQRQEQEKILLSQGRLASMGEMIDAIAHQWRQPLMNINVILMNMDRVIETQDNPQEYLVNKMDEVITLTTHMSQTIEDFRALLRADKQKVHFFIDKSIAQTLELFEEALKDIDLRVTVTNGLTFFGYNNELIQVMMILLNNAIEVLQVRKIQSKIITIQASLNSVNLFIAIEDNAGGIEKTSLDTIFDPYFTTKKSTGGTGLGLYIAKIIIEQNMHGSLDVENTKNGAKFIIRIPNV